MSKVWRWVAIAFSVLMIFGIALLAVAYATGGSFERLIQTTDIADMTKFVSRDQLLVWRDPPCSAFSVRRKSALGNCVYLKQHPTV